MGGASQAQRHVAEAWRGRPHRCPKIAVAVTVATATSAPRRPSRLAVQPMATSFRKTVGPGVLRMACTLAGEVGVVEKDWVLFWVGVHSPEVAVPVLSGHLHALAVQL